MHMHIHIVHIQDLGVGEVNQNGDKEDEGSKAKLAEEERSECSLCSWVELGTQGKGAQGKWSQRTLRLMMSEILFCLACCALMYSAPHHLHVQTLKL